MYVQEFYLCTCAGINIIRYLKYASYDSILLLTQRNTTKKVRYEHTLYTIPFLRVMYNL